MLKNALLLAFVLLMMELVCHRFGYLPHYLTTEENPMGVRDEILGWRMIPQEDEFSVGTGTKFRLSSLSDNTRGVGRSYGTQGRADILVIGDSAMWGWGVDDDQSLGGRLARIYPDRVVVNGAVPGYGTLQSILQLEQILQTRKTSLVILGVGDYLAQRDHAALTWIKIVSDLAPSGNIYLPLASVGPDGQLEIHPARELLIEIPGRRYSGLLRMIEMALAAPGAVSRARQADELTRALYEKLRHIADRKGFNVLLLDWRRQPVGEQWINFWRSLGLHYVRCSHPQTETPEGLIPGDTHPKAEIINYWADCLSQFIDDNRL
jgi:hypothetical protein